MKTSHIQTAVKSLNLQKSKLQKEITAIEDKIAQSQSKIDSIKVIISGLDESIDKLNSSVQS